MLKRIFLFAFAVLAATAVHAMPELPLQNMGVRQGVIDKNGKPITGIVTATAIVDKEGKLGKKPPLGSGCAGIVETCSRSRFAKTSRAL